jgi:hypothetical protein
MSDKSRQVLSSTTLDEGKSDWTTCMSNSYVSRAYGLLLLACGASLLAACVGTGPYPGVPILGAKPPPPYKGPVAASQVAYRIDENRFFEVVPEKQYSCSSGSIYYTDTALGIHTSVMGTNQVGGLDLVIDAVNTQYLIAPMIKGGGSCYNCGGSWLPYSTDAGRTWKRGGGGPSSSGSRLTLSGSTAYAVSSIGGHKVASSVDIGREKFVMQDWKDEPKDFLPRPRKASLDTKFHCTSNDKE